jgi:hypothetical protein
LHTGTFFCVTTTTLSTPRTPTDVKPPVRMALNAYSAKERTGHTSHFQLSRVYEETPPVVSKHERKCAYVCRTDLKQAAFWREHSDMTIVTRTAAAGHCV